MMGPAPGELEVLVPLADGGGSSPPPSAQAAADQGASARPVRPRLARHRWPVVVLLAVVVAVAIGFPIRDLIARRQLRSLERRWAQVQADDRGRITAEQRMRTYLPFTDAAPVDAALAAVYRDEQHRFATVADQLRHARLIDSRLATLRTRLVAALTHRVALLGRVASWYDHPAGGSAPDSTDAQTERDTVVVTGADSAARIRWGLATPPPAAPSLPYPAATAALNRLSRWSDQSLGISLLARSTNQLFRLDIDASLVTSVGALPVDGDVVARRGYVAVVSGGKALALAPDGSGPARPLATGSSLVASAHPDTVWVEDTAAAAATATEVDGSGRVVRGPVVVGGRVVAATTTALVVLPPDQSEIDVQDLATGQVRCRLGTVSSPSDARPYQVAANGDLVLWVDASNRAHLTDAGTCADRTGLAPLGGTPLQSTPPASAAFSPDGRTLVLAASYQVRPGEPVYFLQLIDLASGQVTKVPVGLGFPVASLAWTGDSTRLFWLSGGSSNLAPAISTWRLGDARVQPLRALGLDLSPPLLVVP